MKSNWRTVSLGSVAMLSSEKVALKELTEDEYISTDNMLNNLGGIEKASKLPNVKKVSAFSEGDVLFSNIRTYFKKVWPASFNGGCSADVLVWKSKDETVLDKRFLFLILSSDKFTEYSVKTSKGVKMPRGDKKALLEFEFELPNIDEQHLIVESVDPMVKKIELNTQMNQTLEKIAQRIFKSWFIDFEPVKANAEGVPFDGLSPDIQSLFPSEFVESEMGLIPKGWEVKSLDELFDVGIGKTPPRKQPEWFSRNHSDMTWISIKDMGDAGVYSMGSSEYLAREAVDKFNVRVIPADTVLMSFKLTVGRLSITSSECTTNEAIAHFKQCGLTSISSPQLYLSLRSINFDRYGSTSSIATAINSKIVKKIKVLVPPDNINNAFSEVINPIFEKIKSNQLESETLQKIRDRLLPKLLSGNIEINTNLAEAS